MDDGIKWIDTHCGRMDHGGCALQVAVKKDRIVKVKGDPKGALNRGWICPKGMVSHHRLNHPQRLTHPLKRVGPRGSGQFARISWEEALDTVCGQLLKIKTQKGARSVAFCQGMPKGLEHFVLIRLANLFGSPNVAAVQDVCHAPREVTGLHTCGFYPVPDFKHDSDLIVMWGSNNTATNEEGLISTQLRRRLKLGSDLIVIDPKRTELAQRARLWLQIRPGTDAALALALLNVIISEGLYDKEFITHWTHGFDRLAAHVREFTPEHVAAITTVPPDQIRACARLYGAAQPAAIGWGNAIEQNVHTFDTARALVCLMALGGNLDVPGGNIHATDPDIAPLAEFVCADRLPQKRREMLHARQGAIWRMMTVPATYLRRAILHQDPYPINGLYLQCTNPLVGYADSNMTFEALRTVDFITVADIFMTPTAAMADVVLPAATHFEIDDIGHYGLGHGMVLARPRVVDPPGECRSDISILNEIGRRFGPEKDWFDNERQVLDAVIAPSGMDFEAFCQVGILRGEERFEKYKSSGFRTATGKVELELTRAQQMGLPALPDYPLVAAAPDPQFPLLLTSAKNPFFLHSSYRWVPRLRRQVPQPIVEIHPDTAAALGIADNDPVQIETRHGRITQIARTTKAVQPDVVMAAYGWWFPEAPAEAQFDWRSANYNMLTAAEPVGKAFGTPNLKGIRCRIRKTDSIPPTWTE